MPSVPPYDPTRVAWEQLKSFVSRCEREEVDLAGLHVEDPIAFWARYVRIEIAKIGGKSVAEAIATEGMSCVEHWVVVQRYFQGRYSQLVRMTNGHVAIQYVEAFQRAADRAERELANERTRRAREAADLEPVAGVSLERFAEISASLAHLGSEATRTRTTEVLAAYGIGAATFGSVRRGWELRMEADTTRRLRRIYRQAWTHAHEQLQNGTWQLPGTGERQEVSGVSTRYTWVESVEARPEYRSSLLTG